MVEKSCIINIEERLQGEEEQRNVGQFPLKCTEHLQFYLDIFLKLQN